LFLSTNGNGVLVIFHTKQAESGSEFLKIGIYMLTRVNSTNVLNEGLWIGKIGRRMNSKVRLVKIGVYRK
jgi:hypothetical protein